MKRKIVGFLGIVIGLLLATGFESWVSKGINENISFNVLNFIQSFIFVVLWSGGWLSSILLILLLITYFFLCYKIAIYIFHSIIKK